jgi:hypothetical protein
VVIYYRQGYTERDLIVYRSELVERHPLGPAWETLNQKTLNRWINQAKEKDPDLEVWHVLNKRKRRPGMYTYWKPDGQVILGIFMDHLTQTIYLGPGDEFFPLEDLGPWKIVRPDGKYQPDFGKQSDVDAAGEYLAELAFLGYNPRQIVKLWRGEKTRRPSVDELARVQQIVSILRLRRKGPLSHSTIRRALKIYSYSEGAFDIKQQENVVK